MQKFANRISGELRTDCREMECSSIEHLKKELCSGIVCDGHERSNYANWDASRNHVLRWHENHTYHFNSRNGGGRMEIHFASTPTVHPTMRSLSVDIAFQNPLYWVNHSQLYNQLRGKLEGNGFKITGEKTPFVSLSPEMRKKRCKELEKEFSSMICKFSEKWGEKALKPRNFLEVAQELKELKRGIKQIVDNTAIDRGEFNSHIQERVDLLTYLFSDRPGTGTSKERIDEIVLRDPARDFGISNMDKRREAVKRYTKMSEDVRSLLSDYAIIMDAIAGGGERPTQDQLAYFKYITRTWNK
ncbi:MAG: hypothetical protein Sv326_1026 [Candidatus Fermentimicrarchaeum limneticum]|uniref:Uncharacterized protein n=1 Tax=Fermentimicrarchaeum limneticum TaxID=2795018 RepID=A0A7D6BTA5_FERL1|nr:MAG: hypothetical protein Sv326_1026 [Candidatus Fermentimicrarchaeum limneticum]